MDYSVYCKRNINRSHGGLYKVDSTCTFVAPRTTTERESMINWVLRQITALRRSTIQYNTMQCNTIQVYCVILLASGVALHEMTHQLVYRYST